MERGPDAQAWQEHGLANTGKHVCPVSILLIESDTTKAAVISQALLGCPSHPCRIERVGSLSAAHAQLAAGGIDVVLCNQALSGGAENVHDQARLADTGVLILPFDDTWLENNDWLSAALRYVAERKAAEAGLRMAEEALFEEKERAQVTLDSIGDAVLVTDAQGRVTYLNAIAQTMTGWSGDEALGRALSVVFNIVDGLTGRVASNPAIAAMNEDRIVDLVDNCVLIRRDGSDVGIEDSAAPIHDRNGQVVGAVIVFRDVSQSRAMICKMAHLAQHDALTGLPNRSLLSERVSQAIGLARRHRKQVALLFLDLDRFKEVNDSLGHAIGDQVLRAISDRLSGAVRDSDTVCRLGGDEFVVLLSEIDHPEDASLIAEKLLATVTLPLHINGHTLQVSGSVGISIYPDDGVEAERIIEHADAAMFHAKARGQGQYEYFSAFLNSRGGLQRPVLNPLHGVPEETELRLHYQPQFDCARGRIIGMEALVRWESPTHGIVTPDRFLRVAEQSGLSMSIGQWVLSEACRQSRAWKASGLPPLPVSINISAAQFRHRALADSVANILNSCGVDPGSVVLEVPESVLMQDADVAAMTLSKLKDTGVQLAVDQFGLGRLSLHHLRRFPVDILKIDGSFTRDASAWPDTAGMIDMIAGLADILNRRVIGCGVEAFEQLTFLRSHACDTAQGYYLSYPLPADECALFLAREHWPAP